MTWNHSLIDFDNTFGQHSGSSHGQVKDGWTGLIANLEQISESLGCEKY
jgi:hypothetical protein